MQSIAPKTSQLFELGELESGKNVGEFAGDAYPSHKSGTLFKCVPKPFKVGYVFFKTSLNSLGELQRLGYAF